MGVSWEVWPHATSVIVVERVKRDGAARRTLTDTPKHLSVNRETNYASLTNKCLTGPVMRMVPEPRPTPERTSSALPVHPSYGIKMTDIFGLYNIASIVSSIKSFCSQKKDLKSDSESNGS